MAWLLESASFCSLRLHDGSNRAAYLPTASIDAERSQKGVENHVAGFYVDW